MGKDTAIQWCDSTVNSSTGCDGCELWKVLGERADMIRKMGGSCYAGHLHEGRLAKTLPSLYAADFTEVRMVPGRMAQAAAWSDLTGKPRPGKPWLDGRPRIIFIGDMGDILSAAVTFEFLKDEVIDNVRSAKGSRHIWMLLTKRPGRLAEFAAWLKREHGIDWPENLWVGTSITGRSSTGRMDPLVKVPAKHRFLSLEPLVESVSLAGVIRTVTHRCIGPSCSFEWGLPSCPHCHGTTWMQSPCKDIDLVIVGGESGSLARPFDIQWAREIRNQCRAAGVACFVKQWGARPFDSAWVIDVQLGLDGQAIALGSNTIKLKDSHGGDWDEWGDESLKVREFPTLETTHA